MESKIVDRFGKLKENEIKELIKDKGVRERHLAWFIDEDMRNCIKAVHVLKTGNPTTLQIMVFFNNALLPALKEGF